MNKVKKVPITEPKMPCSGSVESALKRSFYLNQILYHRFL